MAKVRYPALGIEVEAPRGMSLLQASLSAHVTHGSACGGVCACSTCHVYVKKGLDQLSEAEDEELDILDKAFDVRATSRLGCQATIQGDGEIEVELTRETVDTFYNEHPDERRKLEESKKK